MNISEENPINEELEGKIISAAYCDLGFFERIRLRKLAKQNSYVRKLLREYEDTARSVHSLNLEDCPDKILDSVPILVKSKKYSENSFAVDLYTLIFSKPLVIATTVAIIMLAVVISVFINDNRTYNGYSMEEIEKANLQTKHALAIVSNIFNKTSRSLKDDIILKHVSKPINEGVNTVNNLFIEGDNKNED
ncbi:hypothetical protein ACFLS9_03670 [Bacteroidota bacterium]